MKDRGRPIEAVLSQYERFVKPGFHKFILPMKKFADIIIPTSERTQGYLVGCFIINNNTQLWWILFSSELTRSCAIEDGTTSILEICNKARTPKPRPLTDSELPKRAYVLPQTEQVKLMQTILCNRETSHEYGFAFAFTHY